MLLRFGSPKVPKRRSCWLHFGTKMTRKSVRKRGRNLRAKKLRLEDDLRLFGIDFGEGLGSMFVDFLLVFKAESQLRIPERKHYDFPMFWSYFSGFPRNSTPFHMQNVRVFDHGSHLPGNAWIPMVWSPGRESIFRHRPRDFEGRDGPTNSTNDSKSIPDPYPGGKQLSVFAKAVYSSL